MRKIKTLALLQTASLKSLIAFVLISLMAVAGLNAQDINGGTSWNGWVLRGTSNQTGIYANGPGTTVYEIYTTVFTYSTSNPIPGSAAGFADGNLILGIGIKKISGTIPSQITPTIKGDPNNNSYQPASPGPAKYSFSSNADVGDWSAQFNSTYNGQPSDFTIKTGLPNTTATNPCGSFGCGNAYPGIRGMLSGGGATYQVFYDMTYLNTQPLNSLNGGTFLGAFGSTFSFDINYNGEDAVISNISTAPPPPPLQLTSATPTNVTCGNSGSIAVNWTGGSAPYTVSWSGTASGSASGLAASPYTISGLGAGTYNVTVTDANTTSVSQSGIVIQNLPVKNVSTNTYYATIQAAIAAASGGNIIEVCAGTYTVPASTTILVDKPLTLKGANYGVCGTGSRGAESKIVLNHSSGFAMTIRSGNVTVDGFEFETQLGRDAINVNTPYVASALSTMSNFNFSNNIFRSSTTSANKNGIVFGENNLNANQATPNDQALNENVTIQCNKFDYTTFAGTNRGIVMTTQFDMHTYNNFNISDNLFQMGVNGTGIVGSAVPNRHTMTNFNISDNSFTSGQQGLDLTKVETPTIENNSFANFTFRAMGLGSSNGGVVRGNTIDGASAALLSGGSFFGYGIDLYGGTDFGATANGPTGNNGGLVVENNVISNFTHPTETAQNFRAINIRNNPATGLMIKNNAINNVQNGVLIASTATNVINVNENSFTTATTAIRNNSAMMTVAGTCNWYGTSNYATVATKIVGPVTFVPYLTNGTDVGGDPTDGFQPVPGSCTGTNVLSITCPDPVTVQCAGDVPAVNTGSVTATGTCPGIVVTHDGDVIISQTCANRYTITRTYKATDNCGNSVTCDQIITVNDNTGPTITAGTIATCYPTVAAAEAAALAATTATDNCGGTITYTASTTGTCSAVVTVTAKDVCENMSSYNYNTRIDNINPTITCPANITVDAATTCGTVVNFATPGATDNCGTPTVTQIGGINSGSVFPVGTSTITFKATDACGNSNTCSFTVTVNLNPLVVPLYTILAQDEVHVHTRNIVNGNVGVWGAGKTAKIHDYSTVNGFVRAPVIDKDATSTITGAQTLAQAPQPTPGSFRYNTMADPPSDISVPDNFVGTYNLIGTSFRKITVGKNSTARFVASGDIYIKELILKDADNGKMTKLEFSGNSELMIRKKLDIGKRNSINQAGTFNVKMYVEEYDVHIGQASKVNASIDVRFKNLVPETATATAHTILQGQFIAKKVDAKDYIDWNGTCGTSPGPIPLNEPEFVSRGVQTFTPEERSPEGFGVTLFPNPSSMNFTIKVKGVLDEQINVRVSDLSGKVLLTYTTNSNMIMIDGAKLAAGTYVAEIRQGSNKKVMKLVKLK